MATWKKLAYLDEVATLSDVNPSDIGTTASPGTAADASRHDHVHVLGDGAVNTAAKLASDVVETAKIKDANVTAAKLATDAVETAKIKDANVTTAKISIDANLNMNKKELTAAALDNQASDPVTPVLGQVYFKTGDTHPYVCTAT
jgi:hypothetical protein